MSGTSADPNGRKASGPSLLVVLAVIGFFIVIIGFALGQMVAMQSGDDAPGWTRAIVLVGAIISGLCVVGEVLGRLTASEPSDDGEQN